MTAREVAIKEIESRIVTRQQAKDNLKQWIKNVLIQQFNDETKKIWNDVLKEIDYPSCKYCLKYPCEGCNAYPELEED